MSDTEWVCFDDVTPPVEYKIFGTTLRNFREAAEACVLEDPEATLGRVSSTTEFFHVLELGESLNLSDPLLIWIGVELEGSDQGNGGDYFYVDDFTDKSFFAVRERFPWGSRQPNFAVAADCVTMRPTLKPGEVGLWNNLICNTPLPYLCRRNCTVQIDSAKVSTGCTVNGPFIGVFLVVAFVVLIITLKDLWETIRLRREFELLLS